MFASSEADEIGDLTGGTATLEPQRNRGGEHCNAHRLDDKRHLGEGSVETVAEAKEADPRADQQAPDRGSKKRHGGQRGKDPSCAGDDGGEDDPTDTLKEEQWTDRRDVAVADCPQM